MERDERDLSLLSIFHFVMAALASLGGSVPIIHVLLGLKMLSDPAFLSGGRGAPPPFNPGWLFVGIGAFAIVLGWTMAFALVFSGLSLRGRRRYWFCFILACLICLNMPLGTALGVFTLIVLSRATVKQAFGVAPG